MGILYYGKLQVFRAATEGFREGWDTIATFEFGKDYSFSALIYEEEEKTGKPIERRGAFEDLITQGEIDEDDRYVGTLTFAQFESIAGGLDADPDPDVSLWPACGAAIAAMHLLEKKAELKTRLIVYADT